jgi:hypothetical protein
MKSIARLAVSLTLLLGLVSVAVADLASKPNDSVSKRTNPVSKRPVAFDDVFRINQRS